MRLSGDFHLAIAAGSGHATLGRVLRELISRTSLVLMAYGPNDTGQPGDAAACGCREHEGLIDAIRLRDAPEAMRRMLSHLTRIESTLVFDLQPRASQDLAALLGTTP